MNYSPEEARVLAAYAQEANRSTIQLARKDANTFCEYVLRDERNNKPLVQSSTHEEWHNLISTHDRLLVWSHVESGKTTQISIGRTLWELGRNPSLRIAIISNTYKQALKPLSVIARYIKSSPELKEVFPNLKPANPWTEERISVGRDTVAKDPSIEVCGLGGNITGARLDYVVFDDILDPENTDTEYNRDKAYNWLKAVVFGRLTENSRIVCVGTAYHPDDILHRFSREPQWKAVRYPVVNEEGKTRWPIQWPQTRVEKKRVELGPLEFSRQMECKARDDSTSVFKKEYIDSALARGTGRSFITTLNDVALPPGTRVYSGVDLAVSKKRKADRTVITTILVWPSGLKEIIFIEAGKWSANEIINKIISTHKRYNSIIMVENNAAQDYLYQFVAASFSVPIIAQTTGKNKADPRFGVESIATELSNGAWVFPNTDGNVHTELRSLISQMLYYNPASHTGDSLMSLWFAREVARKFETPDNAQKEAVTIRVLGKKKKEINETTKNLRSRKIH